MPKNTPLPPTPPKNAIFSCVESESLLTFWEFLDPPLHPPQKPPKNEEKSPRPPQYHPHPFFYTTRKNIFFTLLPPSPTSSNTIPPSHTPPPPPLHPPYIIISTCFLPVSAKRVFCATRVFTTRRWKTPIGLCHVKIATRFF